MVLKENSGVGLFCFFGVGPASDAAQLAGPTYRTKIKPLRYLLLEGALSLARAIKQSRKGCEYREIKRQEPPFFSFLMRLLKALRVVPEGELALGSQVDM